MVSSPTMILTAVTTMTAEPWWALPLCQAQSWRMISSWLWCLHPRGSGCLRYLADSSTCCILWKLDLGCSGKGNSSSHMTTEMWHHNRSNRRGPKSIKACRAERLCVSWRPTRQWCSLGLISLSPQNLTGVLGGSTSAGPPKTQQGTVCRLLLQANTDISNITHSRLSLKV